MLNLDQVAPQIEAMAREQAGRGAELSARLTAATARWQAVVDQPALLARLPRERNEPRLALPSYEPLDHIPMAPVPPARFAVLAVDGSQIEPDFHEVAACYLINVGHALLRYGRGTDGTRLASEPTLFYPELTADPRPMTPDGEAVFGSWGDLDAQRMLAEAEALAQLLQEQAARQEPAMAFLDGPLIAWRLDWITPQAAKQAATRNFLRSFDEAQATGIPLVGYISRTRSTDLVNLLKFAACETAVATGEFCAACAAGFRNPSSPGPSPARRGEIGGERLVASGEGLVAPFPGPSAARRGGAESGRLDGDADGQADATLVPFSPGRGAPCFAGFDGLLDRQLLGRLLPEPGMRSPVFVSNSSVLSNLYGEHRYIGFFFLNAGGEIGRVEVPQWVWEEPERLSRVHALVYDQITLGRGYPIALSEAHEQAVVQVGERELFFELVRRAYGRHDVAAELSAKALRKRGPIA